MPHPGRRCILVSAARGAWWRGDLHEHRSCGSRRRRRLRYPRVSGRRALDGRGGNDQPRESIVLHVQRRCAARLRDDRGTDWCAHATFRHFEPAWSDIEVTVRGPEVATVSLVLRDSIIDASGTVTRYRGRPRSSGGSGETGASCMPLGGQRDADSGPRFRHLGRSRSRFPSLAAGASALGLAALLVLAAERLLRAG